MREILFRGKRKDNGEWVEGYYCPCCFGFFPCRAAIISADEIQNGCWRPEEVIPETVGQFTGLTDKNGTKIFEGDIIKALSDSGNTSCIASVGIGNCKETSDDGTTAIAVYTTYFSDGYYVLPTNKKYKNRTEVIGNTHDNPELLGGEA